VSDPVPDPEPWPPGTRIRLRMGGRYVVVADRSKVCGRIKPETGLWMSSGRACDRPPKHDGRHRYLLIWNTFDEDPRLRECLYWIAELVGVPKEFL